MNEILFGLAIALAASTGALGVLYWQARRTNKFLWSQDSCAEYRKEIRQLKDALYAFQTLPRPDDE